MKICFANFISVIKNLEKIENIGQIFLEKVEKWREEVIEDKNQLEITNSNRKTRLHLYK